MSRTFQLHRLSDKLGSSISHAGGQGEGGSFIRNCRPTRRRPPWQCYVSYRKYRLECQCRLPAQPGARHEEYEVTEILSAGQPIITWWTKCQKEDSHNDSAVIVTACICRQL